MGKRRLGRFVKGFAADAKFGAICQPNGSQIVKIAVDVYSAAAPHKDVDDAYASVDCKGSGGLGVYDWDIVQRISTAGIYVAGSIF